MKVMYCRSPGRPGPQRSPVVAPAAARARKKNIQSQLPGRLDKLVRTAPRQTRLWRWPALPKCTTSSRVPWPWPAGPAMNNPLVAPATWKRENEFQSWPRPLIRLEKIQSRPRLAGSMESPVEWNCRKPFCEKSSHLEVRTCKNPGEN